MIGDLAGDDEDMMATAYRHPSMWYNPKLTGTRSKLLERTFRVVKKSKVRNTFLCFLPILYQIPCVLLSLN